MAALVSLSLPEVPPLAESLRSALDCRGILLVSGSLLSSNSFSDPEVVTELDSLKGDGADSLLVVVGVGGDLAKVAAFGKSCRGVLVVDTDRELVQWRGDSPESAWELSSLSEGLAKEGLPVVWEGFTMSDSLKFERDQILLAASADAEVGAEMARLLRTGINNFELGDPDSFAERERPSRAKVCIATNEVFGPSRNGGIGTAYTAIAELLAKGGHDVTILFNNSRETPEPLDHWIPFYKEKGIRFVGLDPVKSEELRWQDDYMWRAWETYEWLRHAESKGEVYDVIHFPECNAQAFYCVQAKRHGLAFATATFCIGTHSSTRWIYECSREKYDSTFQLQLDYMEQRCIELGDVVVSPSLYLVHWMRSQGWQLPQVSVGQQNIQPYTTRMADRAADEPLPTVENVQEFVFFGRLETRKGIHTLCDALDALNEDESFTKNIKMTFMGKQVTLDGEQSGEFLEKRSEGWKFEWQMIDDYDQAQAVGYLQGEGRVAVMPSPVDNSPYTVLECIGLMIPFIATRAGGIPELIHPRDLAQCTFYHGKLEERASMLERRMRLAISEGIRPARRAVAADDNEQVWVDWHLAMAGSSELSSGAADEAVSLPRVSGALMVGQERGNIERAAASLEGQLTVGNTPRFYPLSDDVAGKNGVAFEAVPRGEAALVVVAAQADGDYVLVADERLVAKPGMIETMARIAAKTKADILTCLPDEFDDEAQLKEDGEFPPRNYYPLGQHPSLAAYWNCYGRGAYLFQVGRLRELLEDLPAMATYASLEDGRLLTHASMMGYSLEVVPEALFALDQPVSPKDEHGGDFPVDDAAVDAYLAHMPPAAETLVEFARREREQAQGVMTELWDLRWRVGEGYEKMEKELNEKGSEIWEKNEKIQQHDEELNKMKSALAESLEERDRIQSDREKLREQVEEGVFAKLKRALGN